MQAEPKALIYDWTKTLEKEVTAAWILLGRPSRKIEDSDGRSTRTFRQRIP